ncbi:MAG: Asp23/Gls24 family envelope stress response protein [Oscillospiraceae bacterium]|nr:Asp23/Gls24 family envelope stress response protein [Oscillospiraceae bacterium]
MSNVENKQSTGGLKISREVIAAIARVAVLETEGVASLAEPRSIRGFFPRIKKAVLIELVDDFANIEISVNLKYGANIPHVCAEIQNTVKDNVQTMTGKAVSKVNVFVAGIIFPDETPGP